MPFETVIHGAAIATNILFNSVMSNYYHEIEHYKLDIQYPFKAQDLSCFMHHDFDDDNTLFLRSGWILRLSYGVLTSFDSPQYPADRHRPIPGEKITASQTEALTTTSNFVALSGLPPSTTLIFLPPKIEKAKLPSLPYYEINWDVPDEENASTVAVAVDGRDGKVVSACFFCLTHQLAIQHPFSNPDADTNNPFSEPTNSPPPAETQQELVKEMTADLRRWASRLASRLALLGRTRFARISSNGFAVPVPARRRGVSNYEPLTAGSYCFRMARSVRG
jgi:hypothetical protein